MKFLSCSFRQFLLVALAFLAISNVTQAEQPPFLSLGHAVSPTGAFVTTNSKFSGGVSVANGELKTVASASISNEMVVNFTIQVDSNDIGKQADLLVVVGKEPNAPFDGGVDTVYHTIDEFGNLSTVDLYDQPTVWMNQLTTHPFTSNVTLQTEMPISVSIGKAFKRSMLYTFAGYRLRDEGTLAYSLSPAISEVKKQFVITKVSDPTTDVELIIADNTQSEFVSVGTVKDAQGKPIAVGEVEHTRQSTPQNSQPQIQSVKYRYNTSGTKPLSISLSDGSKIDIVNYDSSTHTADIVYTDPAGQQAEMPQQSLDLSKLSPDECYNKNADLYDSVAICLKNQALGMINGIMGLFCKTSSAIAGLGSIQGQIMEKLLPFLDAATKQENGSSFCKPFAGIVEDENAIAVEKTGDCFTETLGNMEEVAGITGECLLSRFNIVCFKNVVQYAAEKIINGNWSCSPSESSSSSISLTATNSTTIQPGESLILKISWYAPQSDAKQILVHHDMDIWGFGTVKLEETEQTRGTRTVNIKNNGSITANCGNERRIYAELYPGGWAVSLPLAQSNTIYATPLCNK